MHAARRIARLGSGPKRAGGGAASYCRAVLTVVPTPIETCVRSRSGRFRRSGQRWAFIACEDTRRTRVLLDAPLIPACVGPGEPASGVRGRRSGRGASWTAWAEGLGLCALVTDAGMPLVADPGRLLVARALAAGCRSPCCPARARSRPRSCLGPRRRGLRVRGLGAACGGRAGAFLAAACAAPLPNIVFESPRRWAPRSPISPHRARAPGGGRAGADQAARGGRARHGCRGRAGGITERGEVCIVVGAAPRAERGAPPRRRSRRCGSSSRGGLSARRASELVAGLTGAPRRALYDAAAGAPERPSPPTLP